LNNWKNILLRVSALVSDAITILEIEEPRIVLVVDSERRLLGTITDGDIRRGILRGVELNSTVEQVMNVDSVTCFMGTTQREIKRKLEELHIRQMPLVDENMVVQGVEVLQSIQRGWKKDNPIFIMAGGFGVRLRPLTDNIPKPMLKIGDKSILERVIDGMVRAGFHNFFISLHYKADIVRDFFGDGERWGITIKYVYENNPMGTAGALSLLPDLGSKLPIIVVNGDLLTKVNYEGLIEFHDEHGGEATICIKEYDFQVPYGVVNGEGPLVTGILEKPIQQFNVNAGIYVLDIGLLEQIQGMGYLDMPQFIESILEKKKKVYMFPIHEYWLDIGELKEFNRAQEEYE